MTEQVTTRAGAVRGAMNPDGITAFLGIPFAAPPVGALRFERPQPHDPWTTPLNATAYGATAPQLESTGALAELLPNVVIAGDDYLNLNVWTPDTDAALPVMVFIHGGSWTGVGSITMVSNRSDSDRFLVPPVPRIRAPTRCCGTHGTPDGYSAL